MALKLEAHIIESEILDGILHQSQALQLTSASTEAEDSELKDVKVTKEAIKYRVVEKELFKMLKVLNPAIFKHHKQKFTEE